MTIRRARTGRIDGTAEADLATHPSLRRVVLEPRAAAPRASGVHERKTTPQRGAFSRERRGSANYAPNAYVGECTATVHPTLTGRVRVRWVAGHEAHECWIPKLQGLPVRTGDRLLLQRVDNLDEPIAVGVVDGHAKRPQLPKHHAANLLLRNDEALRIETESGAPLFELRRDAGGPLIKLLSEDTRLELPGKLVLSAAAIALEAREGSVELRASDDVVVSGEIVRLN